MSVAYVQFSDIHFGQEKGGEVFVHRDVRDRVIDDVAGFVKTLTNARVNGIIVSGDIAYGGRKEEYQEAGHWLDRIAAAAGCAITEVQVVPGNHDINWDGICQASALVLSKIAAEGETTLDTFLEAEADRELLYRRFPEYRAFAEAYNCPLDGEGGAAGQKMVELAPGRAIRFVGLNSALCCAKTDQEGTLLLGARQRVLPRTPGEELVVLCHHPLNWLRDSDETRTYVRSRARVFISGHEHAPKIDVDKVADGCDLLMIASGATVPPTADAIYTYTYNILEFDWDSHTDGLTVTVHPRIWAPAATAFEANEKQFAPEILRNTLGSPNFRTDTVANTLWAAPPEPPNNPNLEDEKAVNQQDASTIHERSNTMPDKFPYLLLRFFRDLTAAQRLSVLVRLGALPQSWNGQLTHSMERHVLNALEASGKLQDLEKEIESETATKTDGGARG